MSQESNGEFTQPVSSESVQSCAAGLSKNTQKIWPILADHYPGKIEKPLEGETSQRLSLG
jgi:hypothetical protein